ncbi:hypothetical protein FUAX_19210 [Fulvitalea axinellae]|uniref:Uncharacterized protein n=2 Tax=Fulvitalea axinellae TaxID=1182444 RepID=A0AAU9CSR7_9BACT|nr:hypothetical protein FUAX_19210 [Fulvitalea axinellae]
MLRSNSEIFLPEEVGLDTLQLARWDFSNEKKLNSDSLASSIRVYVDVSQTLYLRPGRHLPPPQPFSSVGLVVKEIESSIELDEFEEDSIIEETVNVDQKAPSDSIAIKRILKEREEWESRQAERVRANPVYVVNEGIDTVDVLVQDGSFRMIQEAKDKNGVWRPIEYWLNSKCGNSYWHQSLAPGEFAIVGMNRYTEGNETELRIRLDIGDSVLFSAPFWGKVKACQFKMSEEDLDVYGRGNVKKFLFLPD